MKKLIIIGGGLVGLGTAFKLLQKSRDIKLTVLEKEPTTGAHQSTHNSGVLHAGLYYKPGSAKAKLAVSGIKQMIEFCRAEGVPYEICGKLVIATRDEQLPVLEELYRRGLANGLSGLQILTAQELKKIEPYANGVKAVYVPEEGIVDYEQVCRRLDSRIRELGGEIYTNSKVVRLKKVTQRWLVYTQNEEHNCDFIVNCAGLYCDKIAKMAGETLDMQIVPFRGEYYKIKKDKQYLVRNLIYPVPDPKFPFLGVHFTRLIHGGIEAGPNALLAFSREGYRWWQINPIELAESLSFVGLWRFLKKYPEMIKSELAISFSKKRFCQALQQLVPDIKPEDLEPGGSGVRAQALGKNGELIQDFHILQRQNALHILNAPSPAATASLAIGEHIAELVLQSI